MAISVDAMLSRALAGASSAASAVQGGANSAMSAALSGAKSAEAEAMQYAKGAKGSPELDLGAMESAGKAGTQVTNGILNGISLDPSILTGGLG